MAEVVPSATEKKIVFVLMCFSTLLHAELKSSHYGWKTTKTTHNIISIDSSCTRDYMKLRIGFSSSSPGDGRGGSPPFRGAIHAKGFPNECRSQANASDTSSSITFLDLKVPAESCGIRVLRREDGQQAYQVEVDVQFDRNLQQSVDQSHVVTCVIPFDAPRREQMDTKRENATHGGTKRHSFRSGRKESSSNERRSSGNINAWMEVRGVSARRRGGGKHASTTQHHRQQQYSVGEQLTMTVKSFIGSDFGARVVNCTAHDGRVNGPEQRLLDGRGCPIDVGIMPAPTTHRRNIKQYGNPTAKDKSYPSYEAATSFLAFKFPDRDFLHLRCWLQICKEFCRQANCNVHRESYEAMMEEQDENEITRLEVFNSFSVKAPGIESDASEFGDLSRKDFVGYAEDNPGSSGRLLCMSPSRLASAFAFIGLVFLAAIAISVYVCLRSRRREDEAKARLWEHHPHLFFPPPPSPPSLSRSSSNVSFLSRTRTPCPYFHKAASSR